MPGTEVQKRATELMDQGMELVNLFVNKNYLINVDKCEPVPLSESQKSYTGMSLFQIDKIVFNPDENINDKLVSVYSALCNLGSTALLVVASDASGVKFYLGVKDRQHPHAASEILQKSLKGNFPGIRMTKQDAFELEKFMEEELPSEYSAKAIASVSVVPGMRDSDDKEHFVQGLEKFIDAMQGESYTAIFVASPLGKKELEAKKRGYEELYSSLSQCSQLVMTYGQEESESVAEGISKSFSKAINDGVSDTTGTNSGTNRSTSKNKNHGATFGLFGMGMNFGSGNGTSKGSYSGTNESHTDTYSETQTNTDTKSDTTTHGSGHSASIQITKRNKTVESLMEKIEEQLARIKNCESYGLWDSACYFISEQQETAIVAANTFKAIVAGEGTSVENSFVNCWEDDIEHSDKAIEVMEYLKYGLHPRFVFKPEFAGPDYDNQEITPAALISGVELPILMGLPHRSVTGVTSIESAEFGRNIFYKYDKKPGRIIDLGAVYHMGEVFTRNRVPLSVENLTAHCFITGSTGSGKSNTMYKLIQELIAPENHVKFLVIEPAKGEYKRDLGGVNGVNIFTSNPNYYSMLHINPFEFHEEIHVLEHLDRLIEIFSACWPLYAAMPAVLKSAFERVYIMHGWDLNFSMYTDLGNGKFPTFYDVLQVLPEVINESDFSAEVKGNYVGSLVTRVESMTNGLIGQIFNMAPLGDDILFDQNTIVDLSRIGSAETKSLIMGILVLKLSEYRQATAAGTNLPLQHVTIMEEAHNLLKRTSKEQGQEGANVQGKSVEMICNSIAEMRTYGEGFIIVDQSPGAVDEAAIKNTNTKIVMNLPDMSDCESIGYAIGLKEKQVAELGKLSRGIAAVYQNDWLESVLVQIDPASKKYEVSGVPKNDPEKRKNFIGELVDELIRQYEDGTFNYKWASDIVKAARVDAGYKSSADKLLTEYQKEYMKGHKDVAFPQMIVDLLGCENLLKMFEANLPKAVAKTSQLTEDIEKTAKDWVKEVRSHLESYSAFYDEHTKDVVMTCLVKKAIRSSVGARKDRYRVVYHVMNKA